MNQAQRSSNPLLHTHYLTKSRFEEWLYRKKKSYHHLCLYLEFDLFLCVSYLVEYLNLYHQYGYPPIPMRKVSQLGSVVFQSLPICKLGAHLLQTHRDHNTDLYYC